MGTLGVLIAAQHLGLLELRSAVQQVRNADLYVSDTLADEVIRRGEMKGRM